MRPLTWTIVGDRWSSCENQLHYTCSSHLLFKPHVIGINILIMEYDKVNMWMLPILCTYIYIYIEENISVHINWIVEGPNTLSGLDYASPSLPRNSSSTRDCLKIRIISKLLNYFEWINCHAPNRQRQWAMPGMNQSMPIGPQIQRGHTWHGPLLNELFMQPI